MLLFLTKFYLKCYSGSAYLSRFHDAYLGALVYEELLRINPKTFLQLHESSLVVIGFAAALRAIATIQKQGVSFNTLLVAQKPICEHSCIC